MYNKKHMLLILDRCNPALCTGNEQDAAGTGCFFIVIDAECRSATGRSIPPAPGIPGSAKNRKKRTKRTFNFSLPSEIRYILKSGS